MHALLGLAACLPSCLQDVDVPLERLTPPWRHRSVGEVKAQAAQALMPVDVPGERQFYISVPHGHTLQKEVRARARVQACAGVCEGAGVRVRACMCTRAHPCAGVGCKLPTLCPSMCGLL